MRKTINKKIVDKKLLNLKDNQREKLIVYKWSLKKWRYWEVLALKDKGKNSKNRNFKKRIKSYMLSYIEYY